MAEAAQTGYMARVGPVQPFSRNSDLDSALAGDADKAREGLDTSIADVTSAAEEHAKKGTELAQTIKSARDELGGLKPPSVPDVPETPQPKYRDPMEGFGSAASLVGIFGSLLTRRPLTNALNASASVMNAQRGQDRQAYEDAIQTWRLNFEKAKTLHDWQKDVYEEIVKKIDTDTNLAKAEFEAYGSALGDKQIVLLAQEKRFDDIVKILEFRDRQMTQAQNHADIIQQRELDREARTDTARQNREEHWTLYTDSKTGKTVEVNPVTNQVREIGGKVLTPEEVKDLSISKVGATQQGVPQTAEDKEAAAAQAATGQPLNQIVPGYGTAAVNARTQARNDAVKLLMEQNPGMTPAQAGIELSRRSVEWIAGRNTDTQLATRLGNMRTAVAQLDYNIDQADKAMKKLPSSDLSPIFNAAIRNGQYIVADPAYSELAFFMAAVSNESAKILNGGTASVSQLNEGAREDAKAWADLKMTPAMWRSVADSMKRESQNRIQNFVDARSVSVPGGPTAPGAYKPPAPAKSGTSDFSHLW